MRSSAARSRKPSFSLVTDANTKITREVESTSSSDADDAPARRTTSSGSHGSCTFTGHPNGASSRCSARPRSPKPTIPTGLPASRNASALLSSP